MQFIDTHCHLQFDTYQDNEKVYQDSIKAGVRRMICVGTSLSESRSAISFAASKDGVWAAVGIHPHEADEYLKDNDSPEKLNELLSHQKVIAVGEIGLDFYKNLSPRLLQEKALRLEIEATIQTGLPYIFHVRDAWGDFWRIFDEYKGLTGVIHSFSSGVKQLDEGLSRNLYVGLNGIMTFTKDQAQLEAAKRVPKDMLVLETDAPFLAPLPFRGQTCEPKHVINTAQFLANLRDELIEDLAEVTTKNAIKLFKLT